MEVVLNQHLIERQGLAQCEVEEIKHLHEIKDTLFDNIRDLNPNIPEELEMIRHAAVELRDIEFAMQRAWRFDENADFHSHWLYIPHCRCPKMDNRDNFGTGLRWTTGGCPVHDPSPYPNDEEF